MKKLLLLALVLTISCSKKEVQVGMTIEEVQDAMGVPDEVLAGFISPDDIRYLRPKVESEQEMKDSLAKLSPKEVASFVVGIWTPTSETKGQLLYTSYVYRDLLRAWTYLQSYNKAAQKTPHYYIKRSYAAGSNPPWEEVNKEEHDLHAPYGHPHKIVWSTDSVTVEAGLYRARVTGFKSTVVTFMNSTQRVAKVEHDVLTFLHIEDGPQ